MELKFARKNREQIMLRADDLNYELCKIGHRKDKVTGQFEEEWVGFKWFASADQALNKIVDLKLRASDARSIQELRADLAAARAEITSAWTTSPGIAA